MKTTFLTLASLAAVFAAPAFADISATTPLQGSGHVSLAYVYQEADELYAGSNKGPLPTDLTLDTLTLSGSYGITDSVAFDFAIGYAESDFLTDPGLAPDGGLDGLTDSRLGVRWQALSEAGDAAFNFTLGAAVYIEGDYDTGALPAIGDGGSGFELGVAGGKTIGPVYISGDLGHRFRADDIPDEWFGSASAALYLSEMFSLFGGLSFVDAVDGIDIGGPGFSPVRFPEVEEDYALWFLGAALNATERVSFDLTYGSKFDGRNTAKSDVFRLGVNFGF